MFDGRTSVALHRGTSLGVGSCIWEIRVVVRGVLALHSKVRVVERERKRERVKEIKRGGGLAGCA